MAYLDNEKQVGPPCGACGHFAISNTLSNGVGYCERGHAWQSAYARPWDCDKHLPKGVQHGLRRLERALGRLETQVRIDNGTLCGTVDDPRTRTLTKRGHKRLVDYLAGNGGSFKGWEPMEGDYAK